jgi:hypothetical protein
MSHKVAGSFLAECLFGFVGSAVATLVVCALTPVRPTDLTFLQRGLKSVNQTPQTSVGVLRKAGAGR